MNFCFWGSTWHAVLIFLHQKLRWVGKNRKGSKVNFRNFLVSDFDVTQEFFLLILLKRLRAFYVCLTRSNGVAENNRERDYWRQNSKKRLRTMSTERLSDSVSNGCSRFIEICQVSNQGNILENITVFKNLIQFIEIWGMKVRWELEYEISLSWRC